jgi:hypothetical protein
VQPGCLERRDRGGIRFVDEPAVEQAAVRPRAVVPADGFGARLDADRGQARVGHAAHDPAADDRRHPDDRRMRLGERLPDARNREDRADRDHRVRRCDEHDVGTDDRLDDAMRGARAVDISLPE